MFFDVHVYELSELLFGLRLQLECSREGASLISWIITLTYS